VQGMVSSVFGVSAVIGPLLGAFLVEHVAWPVVFWVNLPIGVLAMGMIAACLHENVEHREHRLDVTGSVLLLLGVGAVLLALVQGAGVPGAVWWALLLGGLAGIAVLLVHERSISEPILPLELWRLRMIAAGSLGGGAAGAVMMGVSAFLPAYVQGAMGRSPTAAGLALGAMSVSWAVASFVAGKVMLHTSYRCTAVMGGAALLCGTAILLAMDPAYGPYWAAGGAFVIGFGMGCCNTTFIVSIQAAVPWRQRGAATSSTMFMRFIGQALGAAGCGAVLNATIRATDPGAAVIVDRILDPTQRTGIGHAEAMQVADLLAHGLHNAYLLSVAFAVAAVVLALMIPRRISPRTA
ncbi:MAG: MFS transporter, partial [Acetobacteraceae bacterium]